MIPKFKNKLSAREALIEKQEETNKALNQYRLDDHAELKDVNQRIGSPMWHTEFISRVEKATHRKVWAEDSYRDKEVAGFYTTINGEKTYICSFQKGAMPEFSIIVTDERDLPIQEKRGWRTVLTRLLQTGNIKFYQIKNAFDIREHQADERWRANTQSFKG